VPQVILLFRRCFLLHPFGKLTYTERPLTEDSFERARRNSSGQRKQHPRRVRLQPSISNRETRPRKKSRRASSDQEGQLSCSLQFHVVSAIDPLQDSRWSALIATIPRFGVSYSGMAGGAASHIRFQAGSVYDFSVDGVLTDAFLFVPIRSWLTGRRIVSLPFSDHCAPLFSSQRR